MARFRLIYLILIGTLLISVTCRTSSKWATLDGYPPLLFGHAGERFIMPEHTIASYELAAIEGSHFVEPDLVLSKDGILICYHDIAMKRATDVASHPEFADRRGNHSVFLDGKPAMVYDDWLVSHFTLEELKTLRVKQQQTGVRMQYFNQLFSLATFQEFIEVILSVSVKENRPIGIIPELKHPFFHNFVFNSTDHYMENEFLRVLKENGYPLNDSDMPNCAGPCGPIIFQSFDKPSLKYLAEQTTMVEIMMNVHPDVYLLTPSGFDEIANFSNYICLWKEYMYTGVDAEVAFRGWEYDPDLVREMGGFFEPHDFILEGHKRGVKWHYLQSPTPESIPEEAVRYNVKRRLIGGVKCFITSSWALMECL